MDSKALRLAIGGGLGRGCGDGGVCGDGHKRPSDPNTQGYGWACFTAEETALSGGEADLTEMEDRDRDHRQGL